MQLEMYEYINSNDTVLNLLSEPSHISQERESISQQLEILRKAEKILKHDPNLAAQAASIEGEIRKQEEDIKR